MHQKLFGQGKDNEYEDDVTVIRGPPGPPGIDGNSLGCFFYYLLRQMNTYVTK